MSEPFEDNQTDREFWGDLETASWWVRRSNRRLEQIGRKAAKVGFIALAVAGAAAGAWYGIEVAQGPDYGPAREEPSDTVESPATTIDQCLAEALAEPAEDAAVLMRRAEACRLGQQADPREPAPSQPQN